MRGAIVCLDGRRVGTLREGDRQVVFTYDAPYDGRPVSLTLPVRAAPYVAAVLQPFFANLLPEGWLLEISISKLKIAPDDLFGLLLATCADCVGAVEIAPDLEVAP